MNNYYVVRIDRARHGRDVLEQVVLYGQYTPIERACPEGLQDRQGLKPMEFEDAIEMLDRYSLEFNAAYSPFAKYCVDNFAIGIEWRIGFIEKNRIVLVNNYRRWYLTYSIGLDNDKKGGESKK